MPAKIIFECAAVKRIIVVLFFALMPMISWAADKNRISYRIICEDPAVLKKIINEVSLRIEKESNFEVNDEFPKAKLFVYAQQDINDRKNPGGWSLAIAHVSNMKGLFLAAKLIDSKDREVEAVKPVLVDMVKEEGFLQYLNVAHLDEMNDESLREAVDIIVANFAKKLDGNTFDANSE